MKAVPPTSLLYAQGFPLRTHDSKYFTTQVTGDIPLLNIKGLSLKIFSNVWELYTRGIGNIIKSMDDAILFEHFINLRSYSPRLKKTFAVAVAHYMNDLLCERFCRVRKFICSSVHVFCCLRLFLLDFSLI